MPFKLLKKAYYSAINLAFSVLVYRSHPLHCQVQMLKLSVGKGCQVINSSAVECCNTPSVRHNPFLLNGKGRHRESIRILGIPGSVHVKSCPVE